MQAKVRILLEVGCYTAPLCTPSLLKRVRHARAAYLPQYVPRVCLELKNGASCLCCAATVGYAADHLILESVEFCEKVRDFEKHLSMESANDVWNFIMDEQVLFHRNSCKTSCESAV